MNDSNAYDDGYEHGQRGGDVTDNPFCVGTFDFDEWREGFWAAY